MKKIALLAFLFSGVAAVAQHPNANAPFACNQSDALAQAKCENSKLQLQLIEVKIQSLMQQAQSAMRPLQDERNTIITEVLAQHPGYEWHESQGQGDTEGLRPKAATNPAQPLPAPTPARPTPTK